MTNETITGDVVAELALGTHDGSDSNGYLLQKTYAHDATLIGHGTEPGQYKLVRVSDDE